MGWYIAGFHYGMEKGGDNRFKQATIPNEMVHIKVCLIFLRLHGTNTSRPVVPSRSQQWINSLGVWRVESVYVPCHVNLGWVWVIFAGLTNYREICRKVTVCFFFKMCTVLSTQVGARYESETILQVTRGEESILKAIIRIQKGAQHSSSGFGMIFRVLSLKSNINRVQLIFKYAIVWGYVNSLEGTRWDMLISWRV